MKKVAVLGGGLAGTYLSLKLKERFPGIEVIVFEKEKNPSGLLRTEIINGHVFDTGGSHIIFSRNREILSEMLSYLGNNIVRHKRDTRILIDGEFVKYPLENHIYMLKPEDRAEAVIGFVRVLLKRAKMPKWHPKNLLEWITMFFGDGMANLYLIPYNEKIWKRRLTEISADWVYKPGRLPIPHWEDVLKAAVGIPTEGYVEQSTFYYPKTGGIQAFYEGIRKRAEHQGVKFLNSTYVREIKERNGKWAINGKYVVDKVFSTIPLAELTYALDAPDDVIKAAQDLDYNQLLVIGVALKRQTPHSYHWVYVPDRKIIFHRYAYISNYSPENSPPGRGSILIEVTIPRTRKLTDEDVLNIKEQAIEGLIDLEIVKPSDIAFVKCWYNKYGYPVYTLGHERARSKVFDYLESIGIESVGRWGSWHYWNMDRVLMAVRELLSRVSSNLHEQE